MFLQILLKYKNLNFGNTDKYSNIFNYILSYENKKFVIINNYKLTISLMTYPDHAYQLTLTINVHDKITSDYTLGMIGYI